MTKPEYLDELSTKYDTRVLALWPSADLGRPLEEEGGIINIRNNKFLRGNDWHRLVQIFSAGWAKPIMLWILLE